LTNGYFPWYNKIKEREEIPNLINHNGGNNMIIAIWKVEDETITLIQYGSNDYSADFHKAECSVRGTLLDVMKEINEAFEIESLEETSIDEV
jgi:hypothetical protein